MCRLHSQVQSSVSAVAAGSFVVHIPPRWVSVTHNWCPNDTPRRALAVAVYNAVYCALSCPVTITVQQVPTTSRRRPLAYSMTRSAAVIPLQRKTSHQLLVAALRAAQIRFNAATATTAAAAAAAAAVLSKQCCLLMQYSVSGHRCSPRRNDQLRHTASSATALTSS